MRRFIAVVPLALVSLLLTATMATANTVHSITVTFNGNTVSATGDISGLGSQKPAFAVLSANGFATYECSNNGGNAAPGQNPVPVQNSSAPQDLGNTVNNGRGTVNVSVTVTAPATIDPKTAGCPNGKNWTATLQSVTISSATLTIYQGNPNNVIFQQTYTP